MSRATANPLPPWRGEGWEGRVLAAAFLASALAHAAFLWGGISSPRARSETVELDLTQAAAAPAPALPRKKAAPPARPQPRRRPKPAQAARPEPKKEWIDSSRPALAPKTTAQAEIPSPPAIAAGAASSSSPAPAEVAAGASIAAPRLLNGRDLAALLQRFYPEQERNSGIEGLVVLELHLDPAGRVARADVVGSGGADFDAAARRLALLLRFSPTVIAGRPAPVRLRQAIRFRLEQ